MRGDLKRSPMPVFSSPPHLLDLVRNPQAAGRFGVSMVQVSAPFEGSLADPRTTATKLEPKANTGKRALLPPSAYCSRIAATSSDEAERFTIADAGQLVVTT